MEPGEREGVIRLSLNLPESLAIELKVAAIRRRVSMRRLVMDLLAKEGIRAAR
jgi:hypothetical protein